MPNPLASIVARRDRILPVLTRELSSVDGPAIVRASEALLQILPKRSQYSAVYRSLVSLVGTKVDPVSLRQVAWAIGANYKLLQDGQPVWPATYPKQPTSAILQVLAARRLAESAQAEGFRVRYRFRVVIGPGSPLTLEAVWSSRYISFIASHPNGLGFARPPKNDKPVTGRPYQHFETLVGLIFKADIHAAEDGKIKIENVRCSESQKDYNREIIEMRWRSVFQCPFDFNHACHQCPKGQQSCQAATHPLDYVEKLCPICKDLSEFDPYWGSKVCRRCEYAGRGLRQRGEH